MGLHLDGLLPKHNFQNKFSGGSKTKLLDLSLYGEKFEKYEDTNRKTKKSS